MESRKRRKLYAWNGCTVEWSPTSLNSQDTTMTKETPKVKNKMGKKKNKYWRGSLGNQISADGKSRRVKLADQEKLGENESQVVMSQNNLTQLDPMQRAEKQWCAGGEKRDKVEVRNSQVKKALQNKKKLLYKGETSPARRHGDKNPFHHAHASRRKRFSQLFAMEKAQRKNRDRVEKLRAKKVKSKLRIASQSSMEESQSYTTHSFPEEESQEDFAQILRMIEEGTEEEERAATSSSQMQRGSDEQKRQKAATSVNGKSSQSQMEDGDTADEEMENEIQSTAPFTVLSQGHLEDQNMSSSREDEQDRDMLDTVFTELNGGDSIKERQRVMECSQESSTSKRRFSRKLVEEPDCRRMRGAKGDEISKHSRTSYVEEELDSSREEDDRDLEDAGGDSHEHTSKRRQHHLHSEIETESRQESTLSARRENLPSKVTTRRKLRRERITVSKCHASDKAVESDRNEATVDLISSSDSEDGQLASLSDKHPSTEVETQSSNHKAANEEMEVCEGDSDAKTNTAKDAPVGVNVAESRLNSVDKDSCSKPKRLSRKSGSAQSRTKATNVASQVCEFTSEDERNQNDSLLKSAVNDALSQLTVTTDEEDAEIDGEASPEKQANANTPDTGGVSSGRRSKALRLTWTDKSGNSADAKTLRREPQHSVMSLGTDVDSSLETCLPDDHPSICKEQRLAAATAVVETSTKSVQACLKLSSKGTQTESIACSTTTQTPITLLERNYQKFLDFFLTSRRFFEEYDQDIISTSGGSGSSTTDSETKRRVEMVREKVTCEYSDLIEGLPLNADHPKSPKVPKENSTPSLISTEEPTTNPVPISVVSSSPLPLAMDLPGPKELKKLKKKMSKVNKKKSKRLKRAKRDPVRDEDDSGDEDISSDVLRKKILHQRKKKRKQKGKKSVLTTKENEEEVRFRKPSKDLKLTGGQREKKVQALISKLSGNSKQSDPTIRLSGSDGEEESTASQEMIPATDTNVGSDDKDEDAVMEDEDDGFIDYCLLPDVVTFKVQDNSTIQTLD